MRLIADLETDGLLEKVTKIHCIAAKDIDTKEVHFFGPDKVEEGVRFLASADLLVFHNGIKYDLPVIEKLYPWFKMDKSKVLDTLVMSRLIYSNIKDIDSGLLKSGRLPGKLFGLHGLEAWGHRLREHKGDYKVWFKEKVGDAYQDGDEWLEYCQEMGDYNIQDVVVTDLLFTRMVAKNYSPMALAIEHQIAWLMAQQERNGFCFNEGKAGVLYAKLAARRGELERDCAALFEPWEVRLADFVPKRDNKARGYVAGVAVAKYKTVIFNPNSRDHIAYNLTKLYGWEPEDFTDGGKPKVDEEVLGKLNYPPCKLLTEFLMVQKRISQIAEGDQAWLKLCRNGKIHGSINPNGAGTGRATHSYPNISQVPSGGSPYGHECRELFGVPAGWILVGSDTAGLELRCLAHYMAKYDNGAYGLALIQSDIHWVNVQSMGLTDEARDKSNPYHEVLRGGAKTFIYGFLYGSGDEKTGRIVFDIILKCKALGMPYANLLKTFFGGNESPSSDELKSAGAKLKKTFLAGLPALKNLIKAVKWTTPPDPKNPDYKLRRGVARKVLKGLDGREITVRSAHSALNMLLQGAGAIICKRWLIILEEKLQAAGLKHGWDGDYAFCAWSHDECQIACRTQATADIVGRFAVECALESGDFFNLRCPVGGESKVGLTWADTH